MKPVYVISIFKFNLYNSVHLHFTFLDAYLGIFTGSLVATSAIIGQALLLCSKVNFSASPKCSVLDCVSKESLRGGSVS